MQRPGPPPSRTTAEVRVEPSDLPPAPFWGAGAGTPPRGRRGPPVIGDAFVVEPPDSCCKRVTTRDLPESDGPEDGLVPSALPAEPGGRGVSPRQGRREPPEGVPCPSTSSRSRPTAAAPASRPRSPGPSPRCTPRSPAHRRGT